MKLTTLMCASLMASAVSTVFAEPTLYLGSFGGSNEKTMKEKVIPPFEAKHKAKVVYVAGNSTDTLAKLQAQKGRQELDVVIMDDGPTFQAAQFGFCDKLADAPIYKDVYDIAKYNDKSIGIGMVATGLVYNTEAFKKAGLPAPTSWEDLTNPKFKQKIAIPPISNGYGLQTLVMFAKLRKGSEKNIDPGFTALQKEVGPNVLVWEPSPGKMAELFQNGSVILGVWGSGRVSSLKATGFPAELVYPKEGALALGVGACPVVNSDVPELAQAFLQYMLTPEVQALMAASEGWGPTNRNTKLEPAVAAKVPYGPEQIGKLLPIDWTTANEKRAEWTNRWNRTIER
ncbi:ABC transporter substrate-binding protein [Herbaspirillum sp. GCM10030257]|uniref:ABC transporter substrate-binding protein n=1 Tax=Herbaspirillum sp. GCM10030257 TaxID=3273393 RepID=UPI0036213AA7